MSENTKRLDSSTSLWRTICAGFVQGWSDSGLFSGAASWSSSWSNGQQLRWHIVRGRNAETLISQNFVGHTIIKGLFSLRQFSFLLLSALGRIQPMVSKMLMKINPFLGSFFSCCACLSACERMHSITPSLSYVQKIYKNLFHQPSTNSIEKYCSMFEDRREGF